jgi:hypothetical protein
METKKRSQENKIEKTKKDLRDYARYSNLAFRLIAIVLAGFFGGMKLDDWLNINFPVFTLTLSISGLVVSLYLLIKDLLK